MLKTFASGWLRVAKPQTNYDRHDATSGREVSEMKIAPMGTVVPLLQTFKGK